MAFAPFVAETLLICSTVILTPTCQGPSGILSSIYLLMGVRGVVVPYFSIRHAGIVQMILKNSMI